MRTVTQTTRVSAVSGVGEGQCAAEEPGGRPPPPIQMPMQIRSMATITATCRYNDSSRYAVYTPELIQHSNRLTKPRILSALMLAEGWDMPRGCLHDAQQMHLFT